MSNLESWLAGFKPGEIRRLAGAGDTALYRQNVSRPVYYIWQGDECVLDTTSYMEAGDVWEAVKKIEEARDEKCRVHEGHS